MLSKTPFKVPALLIKCKKQNRPNIRKVASVADAEIIPNSENYELQKQIDHKVKDLCFPKPFLLKQETKRYSHIKHEVYQNLHQNSMYGDTSNWENTWQGKSQFNPYKVPLDLRVGEPLNKVPKPDKYSNLELMKIENFLHLTPKAIKEHCKNLKQFCTRWPDGLKNDEVCNSTYPAEYHTVDYLTAGQTQRNHKARIVTLKFFLYNLNLNEKSRHKIIKLAGSRYDAETDAVTITTEKCPIRKQNKDYADYLLTILYFEAQKEESWEDPKYRDEEDGIYYWEGSSSQNKLINTLPLTKEYSEKNITKEFIESDPKLSAYKNAVEGLKSTQINVLSKHETKMQAMDEYKANVKKLYGL